MGTLFCIHCAKKDAALTALKTRSAALETELEATKQQLDEMTKLCELQAGDIKRYKKLIDDKPDRNQPERVSEDQLQLAFERIISGVTSPSAKEALESEIPTAANDDGAGKRKRKGGRRKLSFEGLPVVEQRYVPPEVEACGGDGWERIGEEVSQRLGFRRAQFTCIRVIRETWVKKPSGLSAANIATAPLPDWVWPRTMADPSVIAEVIMGKYDYSIPLNRQERMTKGRGFVIPRSTQSDWLDASYGYLRHIVDAMRAETIARSQCIATDATGAPVRAKGGCNRWHVFVFIGDIEHVTFNVSRSHTSKAIAQMLDGYGGALLADASKIYEAMYRGGVVAVACWAHLRRYFWKATLTEPMFALEALALINRLFKIAQAAKSVPMPDRTQWRRDRAQPVLNVLDGWVERNRDKADERGKLSAALTYYKNQRAALHRFLDNGALEIDNNASERELRNLVLGRHNWKHFENKTGLRWYATFRSLIASAHVSGLNPHHYLEGVLRLVPHWPKRRVLELAPKYWRRTVEGLDDHHRAIIEPPWRRATAPPGDYAAA